jgi:branched-chain amino acid transport system permease protein
MSDFLPQLIQQLFNGLSLGAIYALIAIGYTMVYGIIGMINFAHGEIYMIGGYVGLVTLSAIGTQSGLPVALVIGLMLVVAVLSPASTATRSNRWPTSPCGTARAWCR